MKALNKCVVCGAAMRPLFNLTFCPNDCDRRTGETGGVPFVSFMARGRRYRIARLAPGDWIPDWATHGWYMTFNSHHAEGNASRTLEELARTWTSLMESWRWSYDDPGWAFHWPEDRSVPGRNFHMNGDAFLAFGREPGDV